jgi:hypothetical protein
MLCHCRKTDGTADHVKWNKLDSQRHGV